MPSRVTATFALLLALAATGCRRSGFSLILEGASNYRFPGKAHLMGPYREDVVKTIVVIFAGRARPGDPQKLSPRQKAELRRPPERGNNPQGRRALTTAPGGP